MNQFDHNFCQLFTQLGLASDPVSIRAFLETNGPLDDSIVLSAAHFWTPVQARFLNEQIAEDADWAHQVDQLDIALRAAKKVT